MAKKKKKEQERPDIIIEGNTAVWEMKMEGDINGTYMGTFRFRTFLTPTQQIAANREYRELIGPNPTVAPQHESFLAYALTQLKHRVIAAPPFWAERDGEMWAGDLPDENVITAVLDAAVNAEVKYKNQLAEKRLESLTRAKKAAEKLLKQREEEPQDEGETEADNG